MGALGLAGWHHTPCLKGVEQGGVGMSSEMVRWGGLAGVLAAVMFVLATIPQPTCIMTVGEVDPAWEKSGEKQ